MKKIIHVLLLSVASMSTQAAVECSDDKKSEVLAIVASGNNTVVLNCNLTLSPKDVVTKIIDIRGSEATGITLNCNNALLDASLGRAKGYFSGDNLKVRSLRVKSSGTWSVPKDIMIKNCRVKGSVRISGLGNNGEAKYVNESSVNLDHTKYAQANAPSEVVLDNMKIEGIGRIPFYFAPGVHHITLKNSEIYGESSSTAVYFGAESAHNQLLNNNIHVKRSKRELIAIDGSAHNLIKNNRFSTLNNGGIYLYRNCGEGATLRHQTPSYNKIEANYFYYNKYTGSNPAIYVGSRNRDANWRYCSKDEHALLANTSATDNKDNPTNNYVIYNQFLNREPSKYIKFGSSNDTKRNKKYSHGNINTPEFRKDATHLTDRVAK